MNRKKFLAAAGVTGAVALAAAFLVPAPAPAREAASFERPLAFEPNTGQTDKRVKFLARGPVSMWIMADSATLGIGQKGAIRMRWTGANPDPAAKGLDALPSTANYFLGSDPAGWRTGVPNYAKVRLEEVYPGIGLLFHPSSDRKLEYDFELAPGADPSRIALEFDGARELSVDANGDLRIETEAGGVIQRKPVAFQGDVPVEVKYDLRGGQVRFNLGSYDRTRPLTIDPIVDVSRYYGGSLDDGAEDLAVDASGNTYVVGLTLSTNLPMAGSAFQMVNNGGYSDAFIAKFTIGGTLQYVTYLGGSGDEDAARIAVDGSQNAYLAIKSDSANFPNFNCGANAPAPGPDTSHRVKLNSTATGLVYSCSAGQGRSVLDVDVSSGGTAYWVDYKMDEGGCLRKGTPTTLTTLKCFSDAVLQAVDYVSGITVWVTGHKSVANTNDVFVAKLGMQLQPPAGACEGCVAYSTTFGGSGTDYGTAIYVTPGGTAYVAGNTTSSNLPNALNSHGGGMDAFMVKLGPGVSTSARYIGGSGQDVAHGIAVRSEMVSIIPYVVGSTRSTNFPTTPGIGGTCVPTIGSNSGFIWRGPSLNPGWSGCIGSIAAGVGLSDIGVPRIHVAGTAGVPLQPPPTMPPFSLAGYADAFLMLFRE